MGFVNHQIPPTDRFCQPNDHQPEGGNDAKDSHISARLPPQTHNANTADLHPPRSSRADGSSQSISRPQSINAWFHFYGEDTTTGTALHWHTFFVQPCIRAGRIVLHRILANILDNESTPVCHTAA